MNCGVSLPQGNRTTSVVWKCSTPLQIGLGFLRVLPKGPVNLLVEMSIPVVDEVHIFVCMVLASATVCAALVLPANRQCSVDDLILSDLA